MVEIFSVITGILGIIIGLYSLDEEKKKKFLNHIAIFILFCAQIWNIYNFFTNELSHITIFILIISLAAVSLLISAYYMNTITKELIFQDETSKNHFNISQKMANIIEEIHKKEHDDYTFLSTKMKKLYEKIEILEKNK